MSWVLIPSSNCKILVLETLGLGSELVSAGSHMHLKLVKWQHPAVFNVMNLMDSVTCTIVAKMPSLPSHQVDRVVNRESNMFLQLQQLEDLSLQEYIYKVVLPT